MSDPSVVIEPPTNTGNQIILLLKDQVEEISLNLNIKRGGDKFPFLLHLLCLLPEEADSQRSLNILIGKEDANLLLLLNLLKTKVDIKDRDICLLRFSMFLHQNNLVGLQSNHRIYKSIIWCIIHQGIQERNPNKKLGPLIWPLMKSSDYYRRRRVQDLRKIILPPEIFQELNNLWSHIQVLYKFFLNLNW